MNNMNDIKVLVVDDEEIIAEELSDYIRSLGFPVISTFKPVDVCDLLINIPEIKIVITDLKMPVLDGFSLIERINRLVPNSHELSIIVISGNYDVKDALQAIRIGASDFLTKPLSFDLLHHSLKRIVESLQSRQLEKKLVLELKASMKESELASKAKSEFLAIMTHELRTPLNAVIGFGDILKRGSARGSISNEKIQSSAQHILDGGHQLLGLINEILDFSRIDSGHLKINLEPVLLANVVTDCIEQIRVVLADSNKISLKNINNHPEIEVLVDSQRLRQIIINLLSNAVKYNYEDGTVSIETNLIDKEHIGITITDTGVGIAEEDMDKLFDPFERLVFKHGSKEGSGIGLAVAKQLVEAMNGKIGVDRSVKNGAAFWIELPIATHIN
jgi:signal transduction histidine kinase